MKKTICLNMIVKNESRVIKRCLESVKKIIDYWVIVDTGSTDGTQHIIKEFMKDIPGELHERPWVNFGHNRNEALDLALDKADYILFIDADDRLVFSEDFVLPELEADGYWMIQKEASGSFFKEHNLFCLMKKEADIRWKGVLHEYLSTETPKDVRQLHGVFNEYINDGARSEDPEKINKEIAILKEAIKEEPLNIRYQIYLGRAYWFLKDYASALDHFEQAAAMKGPKEDIFYSLRYIALCQKRMNCPYETVINSFCQAYLFHPLRMESLYDLTTHYMERKNYLHAFLVAKKALEISQTTDNLFVERWMYDWGAAILFFESAKAIGAFAEALSILDNLLNNPTLPKTIREQHLLEESRDHLIKSTSAA
jgi:glycosyltransferase involved in cell wall biosynthesis